METDSTRCNCEADCGRSGDAPLPPCPDRAVSPTPPLADLLPQAAPMILLTDYEPPTAEAAVRAFVAVSPASPFFDAGLDGVPACVALEYMAQAMALCVGFHRRRRGLPPQVGYVLGSRCLSLGLERFAAGATYAVTAACTFQDEEFGSFDCAVFDPSGARVAAATLTAFQPR